MIDTVINFNSFAKLLVESVPELKSVYSEHIDDYDGMLEHVFMGDVTRFAEQLYSVDSNSLCLRKLLEFLDSAYASDDPKLKELISVSFLENLSRDEDGFEGIRAHLSARLEEELSRYD